MIELKGKIVDVIGKRIFKGHVHIENGKVCQIKEDPNITDEQLIMPGLIDAHIHIESSMLIPSEFARLASKHGTVATVSDPHEIANVLGIEGVNFMIENGEQVPFKFFFGAPSCVPATPFETSGAVIDSQEVDKLLGRKEIKYLSEMMNFPGVLNKDREVIKKIESAKKFNKPIDGHAPGLKGNDAKRYIQQGITTDHECFTLEEAFDKISNGMMIQIREGSAAKNYETLKGLIKSHPNNIMICSDDKHPNDLNEGHINSLIKRALKDGYNIMDILQAVVVNPIRHYNLEVGMLQKGDPADFIIVDNLCDFNVLKTFVDGILIAENGETKIPQINKITPNKFYLNDILEKDLKVSDRGGMINVINALDGELVTTFSRIRPKVENSTIICDTKRDVLKLVVLNRYKKSAPQMAFIHGFGFQQGAIASSVAHDSHNIVAVGTSDSEILRAIQLINNNKGGISWVKNKREFLLKLPVAGIMSNADAENVATNYEKIDKLARDLGSALKSPFMTLSFMSLLVIPELKLSDRGLFDGRRFCFVGLQDELE
jgi:adenine deaminase